ncbi:50S ribosomal protein L20 [Candidatus Vidania fulgoroideorum]
MTRVKRGVLSKYRHKKILKQTKGYRGRRKNTIKIAKQSLIKSLQHHYRDTKRKKTDFKKLWIKVINYKITFLSYSKFMNFLKNKNILINRKNLFLIFNSVISKLFVKKLKNIYESC